MKPELLITEETATWIFPDNWIWASCFNYILKLGFPRYVALDKKNRYGGNGLPWRFFVPVHIAKHFKAIP